MKPYNFESAEDMIGLLGEVFSSARYLIDAGGDKTDVVLPISAWEGVLALLEEMDDRAVVREWLPN